MKRCLILVSLVVLVASMAFAADQPSSSKFEAFGGYSLLNVRVSTGISAIGVSGNADGWNGAFTTNLNKYFGVTADFAGYYKAVPYTATVNGTEVRMNHNLHSHSFMFGPKASFPTGRVTPFVHVLMGVNRISSDDINLNNFSEIVGTKTERNTENAFAMAVGGGVDIRVSEHVAFRPGQFDFFRTHHISDKTFGQNNYRFSSGVVFNFGK